MLCRKCGMNIGSKNKLVEHMKTVHDEVISFSSSETKDSKIADLERRLETCSDTSELEAIKKELSTTKGALTKATNRIKELSK